MKSAVGESRAWFDHDVARRSLAPAGPGVGILQVARSGEHSVVTRAYATSPLKLLTPRNHGRAAWIFTSTYGGGLVDGDRLSLDVDVGAGASALVSTQASTKVYRSLRGADAITTAHVRAGGLLVVAPDPVVCFAGSTYRQVQDVVLDHGASLVIVDWLTSGRRAFGERWAFDRYDARLSIRRAGHLVVYDAVSLRADDGPLPPRLDRFNVVAVAALLGPAVLGFADDLRDRVRTIQVQARADAIVAASAIDGEGCLLRVAGTSVAEVAGMIRAFLGFVPALLGDDPWARKW